MKTHFLVSLIAICAVMTFVVLSGTVAVGDLNASITQVNVNGVDLGSKTLVAYAGDTAVVRVEFQVDQDYADEDTTVKVWIGGKEAEATVKKLSLTTGTHYQYLVIKVPTDIDSTDLVSLYVRIEAGSAYKEESYSLKLQRQSYNVEIFDVDADRTIKAGDNLPVSVVIKNTGFKELEDVIVSVSIPELGIERKAYFEDLTANDSCDDCDKRDSSSRTINLRIPSNAKAGVYEMKIEAFNSDSSATKTRSLVVVGNEEESRVVVPMTDKSISTGETVSYDVVVVNSGSKVGIYEVIPETVSGVSVSVDKSVITVPAGSSEIVRVFVKGEKQGTYAVAVGISSEGELVKRVVFNTNVDRKVFSGNVAILTVILAIVFIVLLVVLIILLTKKPSKTEELEESYY